MYNYRKQLRKAAGLSMAAQSRLQCKVNSKLANLTGSQTCGSIAICSSTVAKIWTDWAHGGEELYGPNNVERLDGLFELMTVAMADDIRGVSGFMNALAQEVEDLAGERHQPLPTISHPLIYQRS